MANSIIEFECRVPVDGYKVMYFDESKFLGVKVDRETGSLSEAPADATEDELHLLRRWGARIACPWGRDPKDREAFFELTSYYWEPEVKVLLEPLSEKFRCIDLFEEAASPPYEDFVNTPALRGDVEGPKALADRFGPLVDGPQFVNDWTHSIKMLQNASKAWKTADQTGDFKQLIRAFSQKGKKRFGRNRIDASITLREDPQTGAPRFCIRPETLLDALWTQLAQAIDGSQSLRNCVVCKRLFTITSDHNKKYCSDACRMRAYRKRKGKEVGSWTSTRHETRSHDRREPPQGH
jgi:hypothetical protein